jgi:site-specific DNA-methyltransferase (adenine-specific)/adenine-specific DNA-methyltransferase
MNEPKEYHLQYAGKTPEQDILSDTMSMPFQPVRVFPENIEVNQKEWHNMLIFGDNLQALKHLIKMKKGGKLKNPDGSDGVKLVYIDPPFATKEDFKGSQEQKAYQDKVAGAKFLEFLRQRMILLREVLTENGSIYVHLDWKKMHYMKVLMDEIFGEQNFRNDIIWHYGQRTMINRYKLNAKHDNILFYGNPQHYIDTPTIPWTEEEISSTRARKILIDKDGEKYIWDNRNPHEPPKKQLIKDIIAKGKALDDVWDIPIILSTSDERLDYPTQKPEALLERIIKTSSNEGDIVLDAFIGSGTTLAVAEKLNRQWIGIDCGKFAIYVTQKRMLNLRGEIGNKGKALRPKPFVLYNAGLYDYDLVKKMGIEDYKKFCLELFQVEAKNHKIGGFDVDGIRDNAPVHIFTEKYLTREFIESLNKTVGKHLDGKMFLIAPSASVKFFEDYISVSNNRYYVLRIPYSVIDEIEKREFTPIKQPDSIACLNEIVDSVGFDFIEPPHVECRYLFNKTKGIFRQAEIKIDKFKSQQRGKKEKQVKDEDALSMIFVDRDYDGKYFNLTDKFFLNEIKNGEILMPAKTGEKIAVIFMDIYGNERFEVVDRKQFK